MINNENKHLYLNQKMKLLNYKQNKNDMNHFYNSLYQTHTDLKDPLTPPTRKYIHHESHINRVGIPINIATRGRSGPYQQIGTLTKQSTEEGVDPKILPLYGKPTYPGSNQWLYYTSTDNYNAIKIPVNHKNKNCQKEYGCQEIYDGDNISVPAYNGEFVANIYEFDAPRYIPYIF